MVKIGTLLAFVNRLRLRNGLAVIQVQSKTAAHSGPRGCRSIPILGRISNGYMMYNWLGQLGAIDHLACDWGWWFISPMARNIAKCRRLEGARGYPMARTEGH